MAVKFTDLHDKLRQKLNGLIGKQDLINWLDANVTVKGYIPIATKSAIIQILGETLNEEIKKMGSVQNLDIGYLNMLYDMSVVYDIVFRYTDIVPLHKQRSVENYDVIMESGFYQYVVEKCEKDFNLFCNMCERATGITNVPMMMDMAEIFSKEPNPDDYREIANIVNNDFDPEKLKTILEITKMNDPTMAKVVNGIKTGAIREAIKGGAEDGTK